MPTPNERPDMAEVEMRARLEPEIRSEVEDELRRRDENLEERDRDMKALALLVSVALAVGLPILGLVVGATVRLFFWASGLR